MNAQSPPERYGDQLGVISSYEDLLAVMRAQVQALDINYIILDAVTGFTESYTTKVLGHGGITRSQKDGKLKRSTQRGLSPQAFDAYVYALGFDLVAVPNPERIAKLKAWLERKSDGRKRDVAMPPMRRMRAPTWLFTPKRAIWLNKVRNMKLTPEQRSELARNAARKRWTKPKITDVTEQWCVADGEEPVTVEECQISDPQPNSSPPENGK